MGWQGHKLEEVAHGLLLIRHNRCLLCRLLQVKVSITQPASGRQDRASRKQVSPPGSRAQHQPRPLEDSEAQSQYRDGDDGSSLGATRSS